MNAKRPRLVSSGKHSYHGFTLVEVMVALTGALFLSISVFLVAKHTTALYQQEARAANANLGSIVGYERLRADLARAGFMASANIRQDPRLCGSPLDASWPPQLQRLQSLTFATTAGLPAVISDNGLSPQEVVLAGNYTSTEAIPIRTVIATGTTYEVYLQVASGPMARLGYSVPGADQEQVLRNTFPTGRAVRIVDSAGRHHYGRIIDVQVSPEPAVILSNAPQLLFRESSAAGCGIKGNETGATINTVNFIRYRIGSLDEDARYAPIYAVAGPDYDASRTELIREELDLNGVIVPDTTELIAEYAVDLAFRATVEPAPSSALLYVDQDELQSWAGLPSELRPGQGPQLVRSLHSWLSVRSREADREADIPVAAGPLFRIGLGAGGSAPFARVRTVQSRVALHNH